MMKNIIVCRVRVCVCVCVRSVPGGLHLPGGLWILEHLDDGLRLRL